MKIVSITKENIFCLDGRYYLSFSRRDMRLGNTIIGIMQNADLSDEKNSIAIHSEVHGKLIETLIEKVEKSFQEK